MTKRAIGLALAVAVLGGFCGCAENSSVGDNVQRSGRYFGEYGVTGDNNNVRIEAESRLLKLSVIGDNNKVFVEEGVALAKVEIWGSNNTVSLPEDLVIRQSIIGRGNVINRRAITYSGQAADEQ